MTEQLPTGSILRDKFEIEQSLGRGGFGITYKARDITNGHHVAIKEYFPVFCAVRQGERHVEARDGEEDIFAKYQDAFREEAEVLSSFNHPNIVEVYERFDEHGTSYFAMAFIEGISLDDAIRSQGALPTEAAMLVAEKIISAVQQIHAQNRLHRDINPKNIMLASAESQQESRLPEIPQAIRARYGWPILLDFGASREIPDSGQTMTGIGTERFGAPEQLRNRGRQDGRTDIYGLGATLYACLAGEYPPSATDRAHEDLLVPAVQRFARKAPPGFLQAIDRAMQLRPEYRPETIEAFRDELFSDLGIEGWSRPPGAFSSPGPGTYSGLGASKPGLTSATGETGQRSPNRLALTGASIALALAAVLGGVQFFLPDSGTAEASGSRQAGTDLNASVDFLMRQLHASQSLYNEMAQHRMSRAEFAMTPGLEDMAKQAGQRITQLEQRNAADRNETRSLIDQLVAFAQANPQAFADGMVNLQASAKSQGRLDQARRLEQIQKIVIQAGQQKGVTDKAFNIFWTQEVEVLQ